MAARMTLHLTREAAGHFTRYAQRHRMSKRAMVEAAMLCVASFCKPTWRDELLEALGDVTPEELAEVISLAWHAAKDFDDRQKDDTDRVRIDVRVDETRLERLRECAHGAGLSMTGALGSVFVPWYRTEAQRALVWRIFNWATERTGEEEFMRRQRVPLVSTG